MNLKSFKKRSFNIVFPFTCYVELLSFYPDLQKLLKNQTFTSFNVKRISNYKKQITLARVQIYDPGDLWRVFNFLENISLKQKPFFQKLEKLISCIWSIEKDWYRKITLLWIVFINWDKNKNIHQKINCTQIIIISSENKIINLLIFALGGLKD